jgi:hypothetical protein
MSSSLDIPPCPDTMNRNRDNREHTLLFRYSASHNGSTEKKAHVYTHDEHGIDPHLIDPDAMWVVRRLRKEGFHAYVVGGAVRDLVLGRTPKDFDIATDVRAGDRPALPARPRLYQP